MTLLCRKHDKCKYQDENYWGIVNVYTKGVFDMIDSFDYKTWKEELWNAITHGIGFIASIPALVVLILAAVQTGSALQITTFTIFGVSVIILF